MNKLTNIFIFGFVGLFIFELNPGGIKLKDITNNQNNVSHNNSRSEYARKRSSYSNVLVAQLKNNNSKNFDLFLSTALKSAVCNKVIYLNLSGNKLCMKGIARLEEAKFAIPNYKNLRFLDISDNGLEDEHLSFKNFANLVETISISESLETLYLGQISDIDKMNKLNALGFFYELNMKAWVRKPKKREDLNKVIEDLENLGFNEK